MFKHLEEDRAMSAEMKRLYGDDVFDEVIERPTITIPAPLAREGQRVIAVNYRRKYDQLEPGTVKAVKAGFWADGTVRYSYEIMLERTVAHRRWAGHRTVLWITVNDDGIHEVIS